MSKQGRNVGIAAAAVIIILWLMLFVSSRALLVWSNPPDGSVGALKCTYFTGAGFVTRQFLYSKQGVLGRDACPRIVTLD